jgi:hypothetical protein
MRAVFLGGLICLALAGVTFVGAYAFYLRLQCCGGWGSASGDPLTVLPSFGIVFLVLGAWLLLVDGGKLKGSRVDLRTFLPLVLVGAVVTLGTGSVLASATHTPGGVWWNDYGFPLPWKVDLFVRCPPWCGQSGGTSYNWFFFAIDAVFYGAIGYGLITAYKRFIAQAKPGSTLHSHPNKTL